MGSQCCCLDSSELDNAAVEQAQAAMEAGVIGAEDAGSNDSRPTPKVVPADIEEMVKSPREAMDPIEDPIWEEETSSEASSGTVGI
mmetsp:Transcript_125607/g.268048  ORF Transcript_125607/g.268048 Transcript_125607/m.268048 type:complete len:86 (+) Transcript_125607:48-305(+)